MSAEEDRLRAEAIERLSVALDLPAELIEFMAPLPDETSGAAMCGPGSIEFPDAPPLFFTRDEINAVADELTRTYLRQALEAAGVDNPEEQQ